MLDKADIDHVLAHTESLWPDLSGARLFVTGGTGFVGKWLVETLLAANRQHNLNIDVTILTRDAARFEKAAPHIAGRDCVQLVEGDIRDFSFPEGEFTHVIHAATDMAADIDMYDIIFEGTRRVLHFAADKKIDNLLLVSSGAVYGKHPKDLSHIGEDCVAEPQTQYGKGKHAAEQLAAHHKIARLFAVTGPYLPLDAGYAAGNFVRDALAGGPIRIGGDGTPLRSYLYARDMGISLWTILMRGGHGMAYNVGSEEAISIGDLAKCIAILTNCTVKGGSPQANASPARYIPSTVRARETLGLAQYISLDEGLRRMIAWNRARAY